jgi:Domain of unknown function (DUF4157)
MASTKHETAGERAGLQSAPASALRPSSASSAAQHPMLTLQQQAGNQAVQSLLRNGFIQAKLAVSNPDDPEEQEADQMADRVMRMKNGFPVSAPCSCDGEAESCESCQEKNAAIQRRADANSGRGDAIAAAESVPSILRNENGHPLDAPTRAFFEPRFGRDFSGIRVHTSDAAAESARSVDAQAYTLGGNVVFAPGKYNPQTSGGRLLLAHELAHTIQQKSRTSRAAIQHRLQREPDDSPAPTSAAPSAAELDQQYQAALADARKTGNWQDAAEKLNGFNHEDIQERLAQLTRDDINYLHLGALDNPRVGPDSQIAQMTVPQATPGGPASDANRGAQVACVSRLGGCIQTRDAGVPSAEDISAYNSSCRRETDYTGPDVTPTSDECTNLPLVPLSTGEKILLAAFLVTAAVVVGAAIVIAGAEIVPVVIASVGDAAIASYAFYLTNAIVVNEIGLFAAGLILSCEGNIAGLLQAIASDPAQATQFLIQVYILHVNISIANQPPRPASVPVQILPPEEQTETGQIRFKTVGPPQFEDENEGQPGTQSPTGPGQLPGGIGQGQKLPALSPGELLDFLKTQRGFGSSPPGIPEPDPKGIGSPMGKGYETYAAIQIVDKDGNQVRVGIGAYLGGGQAHGEEQGIAALRSGLPKDVDVSGGKMIVAVEKEPCPGCDGAIKHFADELKLADYEVYVPDRPSMTDPSKSVTAKQAARTVFQGGRPPTTPKQVPNQ